MILILLLSTGLKSHVTFCRCAVHSRQDTETWGIRGTRVCLCSVESPYIFISVPCTLNWCRHEVLAWVLAYSRSLDNPALESVYSFLSTSGGLSRSKPGSAMQQKHSFCVCNEIISSICPRKAGLELGGRCTHMKYTGAPERATKIPTREFMVSL